MLASAAPSIYWVFSRPCCTTGVPEVLKCPGVLAGLTPRNDADTTGAIFGQIAGAFYGERAIPERWLARLAWRDLIAGPAERRLRARTEPYLTGVIKSHWKG